MELCGKQKMLNNMWNYVLNKKTVYVSYFIFYTAIVYLDD